MTERVVRASVRPPPKFSSSDDFALWLRRFNLYLEEAEVPREKRARESLSLLDDSAFRVVGQLGLIETDDYDVLKQSLERQFSPQGNELEWQYKLQNRRQKPGEMLTDFAGELWCLVDKAYPKWNPEHRLEVARNQFIQGLESPSVQLILMKEMPKTLDVAVELAQHQCRIEAAQKQLCRPVVAPIKESEEESDVNALQVRDLSKQIAKLSDELACLKQQNSFRGYAPRRVWQQKYRDAPICWNCGKKGHLRRMCLPASRVKAAKRVPRLCTQNLAVAHSIYTVQPQQTTITVRVLNPPLEATTVHLNQKIGQLNPLSHVSEVTQSSLTR